MRIKRTAVISANYGLQLVFRMFASGRIGLRGRGPHLWSRRAAAWCCPT